MKVKLATRLLSQSVAEALKYCNSGLRIAEFENVEATFKFIAIMNKAYDILNSRKLSDRSYKKNPYVKKI